MFVPFCLTLLHGEPDSLIGIDESCHRSLARTAYPTKSYWR